MSVVWNSTIDNNLNPSDLFDPDLIVSDFKLRERQSKRLVVVFIFVIRFTEFFFPVLVEVLSGELNKITLLLLQGGCRYFI